MLNRTDVALLSRALDADLISTDAYAEIISQLNSNQQLSAESLLVAQMGLSREQLSSLRDSRAVRMTIRSDRAHGSAPVDSPTVDHSDVVLAASGLSDAGTVVDTDGSKSKPAARKVETQVRFEVSAELGKGGLGRVLLVRDAILGREVALKEMLPTNKPGSSRMQRFISEAQLTGRLEHPGIVPVHAMGLNADGEPFYVMKRVEGPTLDSRLKEFGKVKPRSEAWTLQFQELLGSLIEVCNAVEYAHSRGVIHRDIKPKNIMIGAFGETLLLDWGLAKVVQDGAAQPDASEELQQSTVAWSSFEDVPNEREHTRFGAVVGTVDYMSPEQAKGRIDQVGFATDIYLLGATLYEILTGIAPHRGKNHIEVQSGHFLPPRQVERHVPRALEAVCLKAMSPNPAERYHSAKELADEIVRWRSRERVRAFREPKWQTGARWMRKHSKQCLAVAACIGAGLIVAEGFRWRDELQLRELTDKTRSLVLTGRDAFLSGDFEIAKQTLEQAQGAITLNAGLAQLTADTSDWLTRTDAALRSKQQRSEAQQKLAEFRDRSNAAMAAALLSPGLSSRERGQEVRRLVNQATEIYGFLPERSRSVSVSLDGYDPPERDEIVSACRQLRLLYADSFLEPSPDQSETMNRAATEKALRLLELAHDSGGDDLAHWTRRVAYLKAAGREADAKAIDRAQQQPENSDDYFARGQGLYAAENYTAALQDFQRALQLDPRHLWAAYFSGIAQLQLERWSDAVASLSAVASRHDKNRMVLILRGYAFGRLGDIQAAEADFSAVLGTLRPDDEARYPVYINRGVVRLLHRQTDDAIADFQAARKLRPTASQAYINLSRACLDKRDFAQALSLLSEPAVLESQSPQSCRLRAYALHGVTNDESAAEAVIAELDRAIAIDPDRGRERADAHLDKGRLYHTLGRVDDALAEYRSAQAAWAALPEAAALEGIALRQLDRYDEAVDAFDRFFKLQPYSLEIDQALSKRAAGESIHDAEVLWRFSGRPHPLRLLATVRRERGICRLVLGNVSGAEYDFGAMLTLVPDPDSLPNEFDRESWRFARARLGWLYLDKSNQLAARQFDEIIKGAPENAEAYAGRAYAHAAAHKLDEAIQDAKTAGEKLEESIRVTEGQARNSFDAAKIRYYIAAVYGAVHARTEEAEAAAQHGRTAVNQLRESIEALEPKQRAARATVAQNDEAFRSLRRLPEWKQLMADMSDR